MSIALVMPSNHLISHLCLLLFSSIRVFSSESPLGIKWPKYWSFNFSISPSNEYSGMISFRIDWFYLPAVQGTLKSLLQQHSLKASILWCSAFFMVQFSYLHNHCTGVDRIKQLSTKDQGRAHSVWPVLFKKFLLEYS